MGQGSEFVSNDLVFFSGQDVKIRDCPEKFVRDGHLTTFTPSRSNLSLATDGVRYSMQSHCDSWLKMAVNAHLVSYAVTHANTSVQC